MPFQKGNKLGNRFKQKGDLPLEQITGIRLTVLEREQIERAATLVGITKTEWIREAIAHYLQCQQPSGQQNSDQL